MVYISGSDGEAFLNSVHGRLGCVSCHGGKEPAESMEIAHADMVVDPSSQAEKTCAGCHAAIVSNTMSSIHTNQNGYKTFITMRLDGVASDELPASMQAGFNENCASCHTTCGQCHISSPNSAGGGLVNSHKFSTPHVTKNCTACHGSRIGDEFLGLEEGLRADIHWLNGMDCMACHTADEMHGDGNTYESKLKVESMPRCEDCHEEESSENDYHDIHWDDVSCSVCHSQEYRNCNGCHAGEGITGSSYFTFKIGKNPVEEDRQYEWVTLRHIPVSSDTYRNWGTATLDNYDVLPTWKYTMPHNIGKVDTSKVDTTSIGECYLKCHGVENSDLYLMDADVADEEKAANVNVIVSPHEIPEIPDKK